MAEPITNPKIQQLLGSQSAQPGQIRRSASGPDFGEMLKSQLNLKVSNHAQTRLQSRGIEMDQDSWTRVKDGIDRAAQKGSKESLVMLDDIALVVSVKNRTVITAVSKEQLKESVFTNIDSAVFV